MTKDDEIIVWHDPQVFATKCRDTAPAVADDPMFPYVGKYVANLTLAQVKTLDCGSQRIVAFPNAGESSLSTHTLYPFPYAWPLVNGQEPPLT